MNYTNIDICSMALLKIGANTISNFNQNTAEAKISKSFYKIVKQKLLSSYPWTFACNLIQPASLDEPAIQGYSYTYLLPKNILRIISCGAGDNFSDISYKIMKDRLYANSDIVTIKVIQDIDESQMPPFFINLLVDFLSYEFCLPLTEDHAKSSYLNQVCISQERLAKLIDAQQKTPEKITKFSLIDCRG